MTPIRADEIAIPRSQIWNVTGVADGHSIEYGDALAALGKLVESLRQSAHAIDEAPVDKTRLSERHRALAFLQLKATLDFLDGIGVHVLHSEGLRRLLTAVGNVEKGAADPLFVPKRSVQKAQGYQLIAAKAYVAAAVWLLVEKAGCTQKQAAVLISKALPGPDRLVPSNVREDKAAAASKRVLTAFEWVRNAELKIRRRKNSSRDGELDADQENALDVYNERLADYQARLAVAPEDVRRQLIIEMLQGAMFTADHMLAASQV